MIICWVIFYITKLTFVFNIVDTYFVIQYTDITFAIGLFIGIIGLLYWLFSKSRVLLSKRLSKIHTSTTIIGFVIGLIVLCASKYVSPIGSVSRFPLFDGVQNFQFILFWLFVIILLAQLILIVNIVVSLIKNFKKK